MKLKSAKFVFPLLLILMGSVWIYKSIFELGFYSTEPESGFFPCIMAVVLIIVSSIDLVCSLKSEKAKFSWFQFMPIIGLAAVIACSYLIGTIPSLLVFLLLWMRLLEKYSWKTTLITSFVTTAFIWGVFDRWININFQTGFIWELFF